MLAHSARGSRVRKDLDDDPFRYRAGLARVICTASTESEAWFLRVAGREEPKASTVTMRKPRLEGWMVPLQSHGKSATVRSSGNVPDWGVGVPATRISVGVLAGS